MCYKVMYVCNSSSGFMKNGFAEVRRHWRKNRPAVLAASNLFSNNGPATFYLANFDDFVDSTNMISLRRQVEKRLRYGLLSRINNFGKLKQEMLRFSYYALYKISLLNYAHKRLCRIKFGIRLARDKKSRIHKTQRRRKKSFRYKLQHKRHYKSLWLYRNYLGMAYKASLFSLCKSVSARIGIFFLFRKLVFESLHEYAELHGNSRYRKRSFFSRRLKTFVYRKRKNFKNT